MKIVIKIKDVFNSLGQPTITYVKRENGYYENQLQNALDACGKLCLLTGPSKTGKTSLYKKVIKDKNLEPIVVRCDSGLTSTEFWKKALEKINFERISGGHKSVERNISASGKIGGKIGWAWLANLLGEVSLGINSSMSEIDIREKILAQPSPDHLIPVLQKLPFILIIEDFHYLKPEVQENVFQQWKIFVDNEVTVIVIGTTHHSIDLAFANRDLLGRITHVELSPWNIDDLSKIVIQGFKYLNLSISQNIIKEIAQESVGLPIITQETCHQIFMDKGISNLKLEEIEITFTKHCVYNALHNVAKINYSPLSKVYDILITGPRKGGRKYNTYELVLLTFSQDPIKYSLSRHEIEDRLNKFPLQMQEIPPSSSINSTLKALKKFQKDIGIELVEWIETVNCLYILEPTFLFFLRWRKPREKPPTVLEIINLFIQGISELNKIKFK